MKKESAHIIVPLTPPSVNAYTRHTRTGRHYVTKEALAFKAAVAIFSHGKSFIEGLKKSQLRNMRYQLDATVFLGKGQRGDGDNFWKCIGDGLKEAGIIHSDAAVKAWHIDVKRDPENPRTEIIVTAL